MSGALEASLLDVLIDGFEKNEVVGGFYSRTLPLPDEGAACAKFVQFAHEGRALEG